MVAATFRDPATDEVDGSEIRDTISNVAKRLAAGPFARTHRSYGGEFKKTIAGAS